MASPMQLWETMKWEVARASLRSAALMEGTLVC